MEKQEGNPLAILGNTVSIIIKIEICLINYYNSNKKFSNISLISIH